MRVGVRSMGGGGWSSVSVAMLLSEQPILRAAVSAPRGLFPKPLMWTRRWRREGHVEQSFIPKAQGTFPGP